MAYNTKYSASFPSKDGKTIEVFIKEDGFTGTPSGLTLAKTPIVISYPAVNTVDNIIGCGCELNLINTTHDLEEYNNVFSFPENKNMVIVKRDGTTIYSGYIIPEMYQQVILNNQNVTIPSSSFLNLLDRYVPSILQDDTDMYVTLIDLIKSCLSYIKGIDGLLVYTTLSGSTGYVPSTTNTLFDNYYITKMLFIEKGNEYKNCKEVLESILRSFNSRIYQYNNYLVIDRVKDIGILDKTYQLYDITGTTKTTKLVDRNIVELTDQYNVNKSATLKYEPGKKQVIVKLNYSGVDNLVTNDFSKITLSRVTQWEHPTRQYWWNINDFYLSGSTYPVNFYYADNLITSGIKCLNDGNLTTRVEFDYYDTGTTTTLSIKYKNMPVDKIPIKIKRSNQHTRKLELKASYRIRLPKTTAKERYLSYDSETSAWSIVNYDATVYNDGSYFVTRQTDIGKNGYCVNVSADHDLTSIVNLLGSDLTKIVLFIEIRQLLYRYIGTVDSTSDSDFDGAMPRAYQVIGDVIISNPLPKIENEITGQIDEDYSGKIDIEMDIFDVMQLSSANGLYYSGVTGMSRFTGFTDSYYTTPLPLSYILISDIMQLYNKPRYTITGDVKLRVNEMLGMGHLFTYDYFKNPDTSLKQFIMTGMDFNVKEATYRLTLNEFKLDDGYRVGSVTPTPQPDFFYIDPTSLSFAQAGGTETLSVFCNTGSWTTTVSNSWIHIDTPSGSGNVSGIEVSVDSNEGEMFGRYGNIEFTNGLSIIFLFVSQLGTAYA